MTSLDLLLSVAKVTVVSTLALMMGHWLLKRRPSNVPSLAIAGLLCGCALLMASGQTWPTIWQSSIPDGSSESQHVGESQQPDADSASASSVGISLDEISTLLRRLDTPGSSTHLPVRSHVFTLLASLVAVSIVYVLLGLVSMLRFHMTSSIVVDNRLIDLVTGLSKESPFISNLQFRVSNQIDAPCVAVISNRSVYLPKSWADFTDDELAASIMHEVGHLTRGDACWRLLAQFATACQVFHPLSHGLLRQLVLGQELSADRWAADAIGKTRFVRGISQLALRLDQTALPRQAQGIGMSHSSSFLIRRIKMLRNGMPAHRGKTHWFPGKFATLSIIAVAVVAASWSLSAEEPIRVASRVADPLIDNHPEGDPELWNILPGRTGYWSLNLQAALKHKLIGEWLNEADAALLTPGWMMVAREEARGRRDELGLSLQNLANFSGTVKMETTQTEDENSEQRFRTNVTTSEMILRMQKAVDWSSVAAALPEERLDAALQNLAGPQISEDQVEQLTRLDVFADFFAEQKDPRRFIVKHDPEKPKTTAPVIRSLWEEYSGEIATMIVKIPLISGQTESEMGTLMQTLHEAGEYEVVGVDPSAEPEKIKMRIGLTVREGKSAEELLAAMSVVIDAMIEDFNAEHAEGEPLDVSEEVILHFLKTVKPEIRKSPSSSIPSAVMLEGDVMPPGLWLAIGG